MKALPPRAVALLPNRHPAVMGRLSGLGHRDGCPEGRGGLRCTVVQLLVHATGWHSCWGDPAVERRAA